MRFTLASVTASLILTTYAQQKPQDLTNLLNGNPNLTEYTTLLTSYRDIYANLSFQQDITILVPSNDAFQKIPNSLLGAAFMANDSGIIRSVLQYHVLQGLHPASSFNGSFSFDPTWLDNSTYSNVTGGQVVGGVQQAGNVNIFTSGLGSRSTLSKANSNFTGGIVHVIDTFLQPPVNFLTTVAQFNLTAFGGAVTNTSLSNALNITPDLTIFAPNNDAFQALGSSLSTLSIADITSLLNYHVVNSTTVGYSTNLKNGTVLKTRQGGKITVTFASNSLFVNSARVLQQDILLSNGVLHVIDNVLDYNATNVLPVPALRTQPPVLQGSALASNVVPFTEDLPTSVTSFSSSSATAGASSFGVSDIGSAPSSTSSSLDASSTAKTTAKKAAGCRVETGTQGIGLILGALLGIVGLL